MSETTCTPFQTSRRFMREGRENSDSHRSIKLANVFARTAGQNRLWGAAGTGGPEWPPRRGNENAIRDLSSIIRRRPLITYHAVGALRPLASENRDG